MTWIWTCSNKIQTKIPEHLRGVCWKKVFFWGMYPIIFSAPFLSCLGRRSLYISWSGWKERDFGQWPTRCIQNATILHNSAGRLCNLISKNYFTDLILNNLIQTFYFTSPKMGHILKTWLKGGIHIICSFVYLNEWKIPSLDREHSLIQSGKIANVGIVWNQNNKMLHTWIV